MLKKRNNDGERGRDPSYHRSYLNLGRRFNIFILKDVTGKSSLNKLQRGKKAGIDEGENSRFRPGL